MITIAECFSQWEKYRAEYGTADFLRCSAMSAIDARHDRAAYLTEAARLGFKTATASRCWSFVKAQDKKGTPDAQPSR